MVSRTGDQTMKEERTFTRREALQSITGAAAVAMLPISSAAEKAQKAATPWPADAFTKSQRMQPFNDEWQFHRGDAPGAEAEGFDDSAWRTLAVPHDWSIEDLPPAAE